MAEIFREGAFVWFFFLRERESLREKETGFLGRLTKEKRERVRGRDMRALREDSLA